MAVIKVACPKCGQKVSGDESFYGTSVTCPICTSQIQFPVDGVAASAAPLPMEHLPTADDQSQQSPPPLEENPPADNQEDQQSTPQASPPPPSDPIGAPPESQGESIPLNKDYDDEDVPTPVLGATSLVLGILGLVTCLGALVGPIAIICGHIALAKAQRSPVKPAPGQKMATFGTIIGYFSLIVGILILAAFALWGDDIKSIFSETPPEPAVNP